MTSSEPKNRASIDNVIKSLKQMYIKEEKEEKEEKERKERKVKTR
jgi:hypothetical protein